MLPGHIRSMCGIPPSSPCDGRCHIAERCILRSRPGSSSAPCSISGDRLCSSVPLFAYKCVCVHLCQCVNVYLCKCTYQSFLDSLRSLGMILSLEQKRKNDRWRCPIGSGMTALHLCHQQSEATNGRFSASENTTSLTSLPFGMGPSVLSFPSVYFQRSDLRIRPDFPLSFA